VACADLGGGRPPFLVSTEHRGPRLVLRLAGELDVCGTDQLRQAILNALDRDPKTLVADLSALGFADCAGLSVLVWAHDILAGQGHELIVTGCQPIVRRVLSLTGLDLYLHVSDEPHPGGRPASFGKISG
jgi:anti-sigma B factor antagonist